MSDVTAAPIKPSVLTPMVPLWMTTGQLKRMSVCYVNSFVDECINVSSKMFDRQRASSLRHRNIVAAVGVVTRGSADDAVVRRTYHPGVTLSFESPASACWRKYNPSRLVKVSRDVDS